MKNFFDSVVRTPGVLFMNIMIFAFLVNAGVEYIDGTNMQGPNMLAAACLAVAQVVVIAVQQLRKVRQSSSIGLAR